MKEIVLVGGGGHCKTCIDVIEQDGHYRIVGIVDFPERLHQKILGYEIMATDDDLPLLVEKYEALITIGQINTPAPRIRLQQMLHNLKTRFPVIVSPLAYVSRHARIGEGTVVMHHAVVNAGATIGRHCIINTKALVEHDAVVGDNCHISTGGIVNGGVVIGAGTFWGSGAVSREYIEIGGNQIIGCNATVKKSTK